MQQKPNLVFSLTEAGQAQPRFRLPLGWVFCLGFIISTFTFIAFETKSVQAADYNCVVSLPCPISVTFGTQDPEADPVWVEFSALPGTYVFNSGSNNPPYACTLTGSSPANGFTVSGTPPKCKTASAQGAGPFTAFGNFRFSAQGDYIASYRICDDSSHCTSGSKSVNVSVAAPSTFDWASPDHNHTAGAQTITWRWQPSANVVNYVVYRNGLQQATLGSSVLSWQQNLGGYNVNSGSITIYATNTVGSTQVQSGPRTHYSSAAVPTNPKCTVNSSTQITWTWATGGGQRDYYASNSAGNSGWISTTSWVQSGLTPNTSYTALIKARNNDNEETGTVSVGCTTTSGDTTGPTFTFNPTTRPWATGNITVNLTGTDPAGVRYARFCWTTSASCDPGTTAANISPFTCSGISPCSANVTQSTNGNWYLCARGSDNLGNWTTPQQCSSPYQKDTVAPTIPGTPICAPNPNNTGTHTCTWSASSDPL
ncbi:MAG: hypothetical protein U1C53_00875, partial [Candidatus Veblenbacteria bacterium]|nr:hypothetical protein [Candidatus Veblenbacteria bacterium]